MFWFHDLMWESGVSRTRDTPTSPPAAQDRPAGNTVHPGRVVEGACARAVLDNGLESITLFRPTGTPGTSANARAAMPVLRDPNHVDGLDALPELHVQRYTVCVDGRNFQRCSCSLVLETFGDGYRITCPIADSEADFAEAVRRATATLMQAQVKWQAASRRAEDELTTALAGERR